MLIPDLLEAGPLHRFCDWPNESVPRVAAGVFLRGHAAGPLFGRARRGSHSCVQVRTPRQVAIHAKNNISYHAHGRAAYAVRDAAANSTGC